VFLYAEKAIQKLELFMSDEVHVRPQRSETPPYPVYALVVGHRADFALF